MSMGRFIPVHVRRAFPRFLQSGTIYAILMWDHESEHPIWRFEAPEKLQERLGPR